MSRVFAFVSFAVRRSHPKFPSRNERHRRAVLADDFTVECGFRCLGFSMSSRCGRSFSDIGRSCVLKRDTKSINVVLDASGGHTLAYKLASGPHQSDDFAVLDNGPTRIPFTNGGGKINISTCRDEILPLITAQGATPRGNPIRIMSCPAARRMLNASGSSVSSDGILSFPFTISKAKPRTSSPPPSAPGSISAAQGHFVL